MPVGYRLKNRNSPKPPTHFLKRGDPFNTYKIREEGDDNEKKQPKPTRIPDSRHGSKKPTDPFGRLTMTALDGIVNYLFYSNTSTEEVKASKDQKNPEQKKQTAETAKPPIKQKGDITSGINTNNPTQKPDETPALPALHAFLASLFQSAIPGTSPSQPNATSAQDPNKETSFRV